MIEMTKLSSIRYKLERAQAVYETGRSLPEKDLKEIVLFYRKKNDYPQYIAASKSFIYHVRANGNPQKSYDLLMNIFKQGSKKIEEGGASLLIDGFGLANEVFKFEARQPGVSWMVDILDEFFDKIKEVIDTYEDSQEYFSKSQVNDFITHFTDFEPVSHFSIRTYFSYQLYELKSLRISSLLSKDSVAQKLSEQLIKRLENSDNPLSFYKSGLDGR